MTPLTYFMLLALALLFFAAPVSAHDGIEAADRAGLLTLQQLKLSLSISS